MPPPTVTRRGARAGACAYAGKAAAAAMAPAPRNIARRGRWRFDIAGSSGGCGHIRVGQVRQDVAPGSQLGLAGLARAEEHGHELALRIEGFERADHAIGGRLLD